MEGATESGYSIGGIIVEGKLSCVLYSIVIVNCGYTLLLLINRGGGGVDRECNGAQFKMESVDLCITGEFRVKFHIQLHDVLLNRATDKHLAPSTSYDRACPQYK